jgi:hypothetical protein
MLSLSASAKLEAYWAQLRLVHADVFGLKIVKQVAEPLRQQGGNHSSQINPSFSVPAYWMVLSEKLGLQRGRVGR